MYIELYCTNYFSLNLGQQSEHPSGSNLPHSKLSTTSPNNELEWSLDLCLVSFFIENIQTLSSTTGVHTKNKKAKKYQLAFDFIVDITREI